MRERKRDKGEKERERRSPCKGNDVDACVFLKYTSTQFQPLLPTSSPPFPTPWKGARQYISLPYAPPYLTSLRVLTLSIPLLSLSLFLLLSVSLLHLAVSNGRAYAPINVPRTHASRIYMCIPARRRTHSDRRDYEVGLQGERAHQLPSYNKRRKKCGKNLLSLRHVYTASSASSSGRLLLGALYRYLFAFLLFLHPLSVVHLTSFSSCCALRSSSSSSSSDHRRCCQTTTCTPGARPTSFLRSSFSVLLSRSPSVLFCAGLTRPLRARYLPFSLSYPHAVIYHRAVGFFPFSSPRHPGLRILRLLTAVRHVLLPLPTTSYCYYFPGYRSLTPSYSPARDDATRFINFRDANRR